MHAIRSADADHEIGPGLFFGEIVEREAKDDDPAADANQVASDSTHATETIQQTEAGTFVLFAETWRNPTMPNTKGFGRLLQGRSRITDDPL